MNPAHEMAQRGLASGLGVAGALLAGAYAASYFAEVHGIHDVLYPGALRRVSTPHVVLTFDDGPDPERTPRLLDVLGEAGARATFFLVGERVRRSPGLVRRMAREGHRLGNHSQTHAYLPLCSTRRIERELDECQAAIFDAAGAAPTLARPPYGQKDFRYYRLLAERGMRPVLWSRNLRDYYRTSTDTLLGRLIRARPGDIVLCHDGDPLAPHTVSAVERFLRAGAKVGLLPADAHEGVVG